MSLRGQRTVRPQAAESAFSAPKGLDALMKPKSIAVVGASTRSSRGTKVVVNLKSLGFPGGIYPINPKYDSILDLKCYPSVQEISSSVDCIVVAIPAESAVKVLAEAFDSGVRAAVVLSGGFGEGEQVGAERVAVLRELSDAGMRICGPNCYGILNVHDRASAFSGDIPRPLVEGGIGLVSQSGGFTNVITEPLMEQRNLGFSYLISCGNQLGVTIEDYIEFLVEDEGTKVIVVFAEGLRKPGALRRIAPRASELGKPIIMLTTGRSESGRSAARSHTGALAGNPEILAALLSRAGVIQVQSLDELLDMVCLLAVTKQPPPLESSVVVVTGNGGEGSHTADAACDAGLSLPAPSKRTVSALREILPEFGAAANPIDGTGAMFEDETVFPRLLEAALKDDAAMVAVNFRTPIPKRPEWAPFRRFAEGAARSDHHHKLLVGYTSTAAGVLDEVVVESLQAAGIPLLAGPRMGMQTLARYYEYGRAIARLRTEDLQLSTTAPAPPESLLPEGVEQLTFTEAAALLDYFDIEVPPFEVVRSVTDAVTAAERLGFPVAIKIDSRELPHKSDIGAVFLDCETPDDVLKAFNGVVGATETMRPDLLPCDVLVQSMVPLGTEIILGIIRDRAMGPAVVLGLGGIFTEILDEAIVEVPPITPETAERMVHRSRVGALLSGQRGREAADIPAVIELLVKLGELATTLDGHLEGLDLNPVIVGAKGSGIAIVDVMVQLDTGKGQ